MIYRVRSKSTTLDFGSQQAAFQFLDNFPPHMQDDLSIYEPTSVDIQKSLEILTVQLRKCAPKDDDAGESRHYQWLLSRMEFYTKALTTAEATEQAIASKVANLPTVDL